MLFGYRWVGRAAWRTHAEPSCGARCASYGSRANSSLRELAMTRPECVGGIVARVHGTTAPDFSHLLRSFKGMATNRPEYLALLQTP